MPSKVGYNVIGSSGEAEGYSAKTLELHSPTTPGWQTPKFCTYPQELVIRLHESTRIKKLQLLSHQYMIPSKVEFYVGNRDSPESFKRLGYIYLSNNEKTGFKSRELKSVHVDAEGQYVRILVHKNHLNKFNAYNQACIMAFNVIGDTSTSLQTSLHRNHAADYLDANGLADSTSKQDYISPMDDLAFDMYQDPEVAEIIRRLDKRKKQAVRDENFDIAKRMKQAIADLQKVGEKLARYELDKRRAVENEDYDLAKSKKAQMEDYRLKVYQQLQKYNLLDDAGISSQKPKDNLSPLRQSQHFDRGNNDYLQQFNNNQTETTPSTHRSYRDDPPVVHHDPVDIYRVSPTPSPIQDDIPELDLKQITEAEEIIEDQNSPITAERYDEKVIPTLSKKKPQEFPPEYEDEFASPGRNGSSPDHAGRPDHSSGPEAMSEKNIREAATAIDVFGLPLVAGAYSKTWSFREDTLLAVYKLLNALPVGTPKEELRTQLKAALFLVKRSIRDKVHSVFHASLRLLELILVDFIPRHKLGKPEASRAVNLTLPNLILKTGETAVRPRSSAMEFIDKMSTYPTVEPTQIVPQQLLIPFKRDMANRLALSKVEMVEKLLLKIGLQETAMTVDTLMTFCVAALEHASGQVREVATRIILQTYRLGGAPVKTYLPPDDSRSRKSPLYRNIFDQFDKIDGKPTQSQLRSKAAEEDQQKRQELEELQSQVNQLRVTNNKIEDYRAMEYSQEDYYMEEEYGQMEDYMAEECSQLENSKSPRDTKNKIGTKSKPSDPASLGGGGDDDELDMDKMCIFCGEYDETFNESGLDMHYWKNCPMLKRCEHCKQVVEIPLYSSHLLNECERRSEFGKCPRCGEVMPKNILAKHVPAKKCPVLNPATQEHCPICNKNIASGEESWKKHLMGSRRDACAENPRRVAHINRIQSKQESPKRQPGRR